MGESFDHCPPGWIRQSRKRCTQFIHNHMVVDCLSVSTTNFEIALSAGLHQQTGDGVLHLYRLLDHQESSMTSSAPRLLGGIASSRLRIACTGNSSADSWLLGSR